MPVFSYSLNSLGRQYTEEAISQVKMLPESWASSIPGPASHPKHPADWCSLCCPSVAPRAWAQYVGICSSWLHCMENALTSNSKVKTL